MPRLAIPLLLLFPILTGCAQMDPYRREGVWRPNGANDSNLRAMVAVPSDLARGAPEGPADAALTEAALRRLHEDRVRPLPDSGLARIVPVAAGSGGPPAAAGAGN